MQTGSPFSLKGLLVGTSLSVFIGLVGTYGMMHAYAEIGFNPSSPAAIFLFLVVTLFINSVLRLLARPLALSRADLVLVYAMMLMSLTVPTWGFLFFLFGTMVWPFYHATPENRFGEMYLDWIPEWIAPHDLTAIKHYYEGLPEGMPLQWGAWLEPLANWFLFFLVIGFMLICLSAIFHRQWSSYERLTYPMMQLPERMIEEGGRGLIAPFFRDRTMWIGFSIPFFLFSLSGLHHFYPVIPAFPFHHGHIPLAGPTVNLPVVFSFAWVGFFFLVNLDITFSIWFFFVLFKIQRAVFTTLGIAGSEVLSAYEGGGAETDITHQATGAAIVFVLFVVWSARRHLKEAALKAWSGSGDPADADELMSYRTAVFGFAAGMGFFAFWLWRTGVPAVVIPIVLFVGLCWYIFITRVVTGAGVASARGSPGAGVLRHLRVRHRHSRRQGDRGAQLHPGLAGRDAPVADDRLLQRPEAGRAHPRTQGPAVLGADDRPGGDVPLRHLDDHEDDPRARRPEPLQHQLGRGPRLAAAAAGHERDAGGVHARLVLHRGRGHWRSSSSCGRSTDGSGGRCTRSASPSAPAS